MAVDVVKKIYKLNPHNLFDGCLYFLRNQIKYSKDSTSRWSSAPIENIVNSVANHNSYVCNDNTFKPNLTLDLNGAHVVPVSYSLMGRRGGDDDYYLKSWELKGRKQNGKWVLLHSQSNNPFSFASTKNFTLRSINSYNAFKIAMTDKTQGGNGCLNIGHIEIFGIISNVPIILSAAHKKNRSTENLIIIIGVCLMNTDTKAS